MVILVSCKKEIVYTLCLVDENKPAKLFSYLKTFFLIASILYFFIGIRKINQKLDSIDQKKEARVTEARVKGASASRSIAEYSITAGGSASSVIDGSPATWWYGSTGAEPVSLTMELSAEVPVGEVDITFIDGRQSTDYAIFLKDGDSWVTVKDVVGNKDQIAREVIDPTRIISTREVKLAFYKALVGDGLTGVSEVKIFKRQ